MFFSHDEDFAAIRASATPDHLWQYLVTHFTLRAEISDFDAISMFKRLHGEGKSGALRTVVLLCTDPRWRNCTTGLPSRLEETGVLTPEELDELADGFLWEDDYGWPVPQGWIHGGGRRPSGGSGRQRPGMVVIERIIPAPLRRWAAARIVGQEPTRWGDVLARVDSLEARAGDAVMVGLLEVTERLPAPAGEELIELGCGWTSGTVRLPALRLLALRDVGRARTQALGDPSATVRRKADRLLPASCVDPVNGDLAAPDTCAGSEHAAVKQLSMFG